MNCPNCGKDTITYKLLATTSVSDPILCDSCRQMVFQYKFISEIGQLVAVVTFHIGVFLMAFEEWLRGGLLIVLTLASYFGTQYLEIHCTRLRLVEPKRSKWVQIQLSSVVLLMGLGVFVVFLKLLPLIYEEFANKLFPNF